MASIILTIFGFYLLLGLLFSIAFLWKGITKVDADAAGTSRYFKLLILPGTIIFWPLLLGKWIKAGK